ncbi:MAG: hypothetical protein H8E66_29100 [Planctomycetes bacterium]|nr:hypothetical protein [Planctomycetota bacterium]
MKTRQFVVLRHEPGKAGPRELHWDLMLEFGDSLRTWALLTEPQFGEEILADELPRHRSEYLTYEGPVSNGRGSVRRFDHGTFELAEDSPDQLCAKLNGKLLRGNLRLHHDQTNHRWTVLLTPG